MWFKCCAQHLNRVEHRLFSFISQNRRGTPLTNLSTIVNLTGSTATGTGLKVHCECDTNDCPTRIKLGKSEMVALDIRRADFHCDWNHTLLPTPADIAVIS